jgi:hypothetical protein
MRTPLPDKIPSLAVAILLVFPVIFPANPDPARGETQGLKPVWAALRESGLKPSGGSPKAMDLDGDGQAEYIGRARTYKSYNGRRLSAFYIVGKAGDDYKVLYKLVGNFEVSGESLIDFNGDHTMDYYFRYGRDGRDFGYVLVWVQPGSAKPIYQKKSPYSFDLEDLDKDGRSEIIQAEGALAGPGRGDPETDWRWRDVYRWDPGKTTYVRDNGRYPEFFRKRGEMYESLLAQIDAQDVPGFEWSANEEFFLDLRRRIETDYLKRIASITNKH